MFFMEADGMRRMDEKIKSIIRIEKETYDIYRLLDSAEFDDKSRDTLRRCAADASQNLQILEEKYSQTKPSLAIYLQHFVPEVEFVGDNVDEKSLLKNMAKNRKELVTLYSDLSEMDHDPELCDMFRALAEKISIPSEV